MRLALDLFFLADGLLLTASSWLIAQHMKIPGNRSTGVRLLGLADDPGSVTYRFATTLITGVLLSGAALADLAG